MPWYHTDDYRQWTDEKIRLLETIVFFAHSPKLLLHSGGSAPRNSTTSIPSQLRLARNVVRHFPRAFLLVIFEH